jgi:hypothetical protein
LEEAASTVPPPSITITSGPAPCVALAATSLIQFKSSDATAMAATWPPSLITGNVAIKPGTPLTRRMT